MALCAKLQRGGSGSQETHTATSPGLASRALGAGLEVGGEGVGQEKMHLGRIQVWSTNAGHELVNAGTPA